MAKYPTNKRNFISDVTDVGAFTRIFHTGFKAHNILLSNDSSNSIDYSLDGTTIDGIILAGDTLELRDYIVMDTIYFKSTAGNDAFRIWVW
jgi:hypothetical protein